MVEQRHLPVPDNWKGGAAKDLQRRIDAVPDWIRPAFSEFRNDVHERAKTYQKANPRPKRKELRLYLAGFVRTVSNPLEVALQGAVAAGYYWPLPDEFNRWTAGFPSAASAIVGETVVWGSAFTSTAGGLTVATVSEMLDTYAIASARTRRYRWARQEPGPAVIRADVTAILDATGHGFAMGALGQLGLENLGELAAQAAGSIIGDLAVPAYGAYVGGRRTRRALRMAFDRQLSPLPETGPPVTPDFSGPPPTSFYDWFRREANSGGMPPLPGGLDPA